MTATSFPSLCESYIASGDWGKFSEIQDSLKNKITELQRVCLGTLKTRVTSNPQEWTKSISDQNVQRLIEESASLAVPLFKAIGRRNLEDNKGRRIGTHWPKLMPVYLLGVPKSVFIEHFGSNFAMRRRWILGLLKGDQFCPFLDLAYIPHFYSGLFLSDITCKIK
jgi:hypothetical protein